MSGSSIYKNAVNDYKSIFGQAGGPDLDLPFWPNLLADENLLAKLRNDKVEFEVDGRNLGNKLKSSIPTTLTVEPAVILFEAGLALTPATSWSDGRVCFALHRYGAYFQGVVNGKQLILHREVQAMDSNMKRMLSEELAVGVTCHVMRQVLRIRHIADVKAALHRGFAEREKVTKPGTSIEVDNLKSPDFCGLNSADKLCFVESKGTVVDQAALDRQIKTGKMQLKAVKAVQLSNGPNFVVGTYFASVGNGSKRSKIIIDDPDGAESVEGPNQLDRFVLLSYAKVFRYAGNNRLADQFLYYSDRDMRVWGKLLGRMFRSDQVFIPIGFNAVGDCVLMYRDVLRELLLPRPRLNDRIRYVEIPPKSDGKIVLSNGVALIHRPADSSIEKG